MSFLGWIRSWRERGQESSDAGAPGRNGLAQEYEQVPPSGFTERGNVTTSLEFTDRGKLIRSLSQADWNSDRSGAYEFRQHIGRSVEGYHGGFEVAPRGEDGIVYWSNPRSTQDAAEKASYGMREAWNQGRGQQWSNREDKRQKFRGSSWER